MLTSVAFVVCQVSVVDWPASIVFGLADSEAVGAVNAGGGGGGGGATFFAHAPRNTNRPSANTSVPHLVIVIVIVAVFVFACFTDSSCLCACIVACYLQLDGRAHTGQPQNRASFQNLVSKPVFRTNLLPTPVGLCVGALKRQLLHIGAVRQHGPYLVATRAVRLKHNVPPIRRPAGKIVAPRVVRELYPL